MAVSIDKMKSVIGYVIASMYCIMLKVSKDSQPQSQNSKVKQRWYVVQCAPNQIIKIDVTATVSLSLKGYIIQQSHHQSLLYIILFCLGSIFGINIPL